MNRRVPEWIDDDILHNRFPWEQAVLVSMETFLANYTLHDSYWMGLFLQPADSYIALIKWDTFWTNGRITYGKDISQLGYPLLIILFERVYQVLVSNPSYFGTTVIGHVESTLISDDHLTKIFDSWNQLPLIPNETKRGLIESELYQTRFVPALGGQVDILHAGETRFLCVDWEQNVLPIPFE